MDDYNQNQEKQEEEHEPLTDEVCSQILSELSAVVDAAKGVFGILINSFESIIAETGYKPLEDLYTYEVYYRGVFDIPSTSNIYQSVAVTDEGKRRAIDLEKDIWSTLNSFQPSNCLYGIPSYDGELEISNNDFAEIRGIIQYNGAYAAAEFDKSFEHIADGMGAPLASVCSEMKQAIVIYLSGLQEQLDLVEKDFDDGVERVKRSISSGGKAYNGYLPTWRYEEE